MKIWISDYGIYANIDIYGADGSCLDGSEYFEEGAIGDKFPLPADVDLDRDTACSMTAEQYSEFVYGCKLDIEHYNRQQFESKDEINLVYTEM